MRLPQRELQPRVAPTPALPGAWTGPAGELADGGPSRGRVRKRLV